jgi:NAD(P)-dependent dehydrogenase (short-subunit alcohol dehydrogenase family)
VTGATGSLGRVVANRFARDNARLALVGRDQSALDGLGGSLGVRSDQWLTVIGELTNAEAAARVAAAVNDHWDRIDVLIHVVGGWAGGTPVVEIDEDEIRNMLDQHLWTTLHIVRAVVPGMMARGFGRVMAVSSPFATDVRAKGSSYAIGKASQEALLKSLAREVAGSGVTANMVLVRTIDAKHQRETAPDPKNANWTTPEEIADVFAFLASPASASINGARIPLDGRS